MATPKTGLDKAKKGTPVAVSSAKSTDATKQHTTQIQELVNNETQLGTILRAICENNELDLFTKNLQDFEAKTDGDIELMCNVHYQGFVETVEELLTIQADATSLRDEVSNGNDILQSAGADLMNSAQKLLDCRSLQYNVALGMECISACLPVLTLFEKIIVQIQSGKYYPALRSLDALEHIHLDSIPSYEFVKMIRGDIPNLREYIRKVVFKEMRDWLAQIRELSRIVAKRAIIEAGGDEPEVHVPATASAGLIKNSSSVSAAKDGVGSSSAPSSSVDSVGPEDVVDYTPVYRCVHIYSILGRRAELEGEYRDARRTQAQLAFAPLASSTFENFTIFFHDILGFFIVEATIVETARTLSSRNIVDELWGIAVSQITAYLDLASQACTEATELMRVKKLLVVLCRALQAREYSVSRLLEMLNSLRDRYIELLCHEWNHKFAKLMEQQPFDLFVINSEDDYIALDTDCPSLAATMLAAAIPTLPPDHQSSRGSDPAPSQVVMQLPFSFPWSKYVVAIYANCQQFLLLTLQFLEDMHLPFSEVNESLRRASNQIISNSLSQVIAVHIRAAKESLPQLVQLVINLTALEVAFSSLEGYMTDILRSSIECETVNLIGPPVMHEHREAAELAIESLLKRKVADFSELMEYQWNPAAPSTKASAWLVDFFAYIRNNLQSISAQSMPPDINALIYSTICQATSVKLLDTICLPPAKMISVKALSQFVLEADECEKFASQSKDLQTKEAFVAVRQLCNLFLQWDFDDFLDPKKRAIKYNRVPPWRVVAVLEKIKPDDPTAFPSQLPKNKKRLIDSLIGQVKAIV